jgi:NhaP-type Na+/H+ or K+/H+ antiporter
MPDKLSLSAAIVLGAVATATAPAATLMVIHQYKAKGPLVDLLLPVVALDDALGLIFFAISVSISKVIATGTAPSFMSLCVIPLIEIIGSIVLGFLLGLLLRVLINFFKSRNNHVIMIIAFTLIGVGACSLLNMITIDGNNLEFSNLLCCMMIGATYINFGSDEHIVERDFSLVERWTPSLFLLFFVLSGAHLVTSGKELLSNDTNMLFVLIIFVAYIVARSLGKYFGAYLGCKITKRNKHITNYLGLTLLPQAGVAIGMANTISKMEAFNNGTGDIIVTVVLCATLIYELFGPLLTKWALRKTGEIPNESGIYPYEENKKS